LYDLQNQLSPFSYTSDWIGKVVVILAVASALLAIGGLAWRWYANRKAKRLAAALGAKAT
ncbi:MAG: N-acetylmuramidase, partial [Mesorhizobium sp.]